MLSELYAAHAVVRDTFVEASAALGYDLWQLVAEGPEAQLNETDKAQSALLTSSVACWRLWQQQGGATPVYLAGHSLGEYSAHVAAGTLSFADALRGKPNDAEALNGMGVALALQKKSEAPGRFLAAIKADQYLIDAWINLALLYLSEGRPAEAEILLNGAAQRDPDSAIAAAGPGFIALLKGAHAEAAPAFERARKEAGRGHVLLLAIDEALFADLFDVHDLVMDLWNDCDGMEVMPVYSPHPVENNIFLIRVRDEESYKTYAHWADITSFDVLSKMLQTSPAREVLGWQPKMTLEEGMRRTESWLREVGMLR